MDVPKNNNREKLIDTLKDSWGKDLTKSEIVLVISGSDEEAKRIIKKYRLTHHYSKGYLGTVAHYQY